MKRIRKINGNTEGSFLADGRTSAIFELVDLDTDEVTVESIENLESDIFGVFKIDIYTDTRMSKVLPVYFVIDDTEYAIAKSLDYVGIVYSRTDDILKSTWYGGYGSLLNFLEGGLNDDFIWKPLKKPYVGSDLTGLLVGKKDYTYSVTLLTFIKDAFGTIDNINTDFCWSEVAISEDMEFLYIPVLNPGSASHMTYLKFKILDYSIFAKLILASGQEGYKEYVESR